MLILVCVFEGQFSETLCFAIAVLDFFTTASNGMHVCSEKTENIVKVAFAKSEELARHLRNLPDGLLGKK